MITPEEVTKAVQQMSHNKAHGKDNINIELTECALRELH